jgi:hypothetical protein
MTKHITIKEFERIFTQSQEAVIRYLTRCHQGLGNVIPFPRIEDNVGSKKGRVIKKSRLKRLLNYYHWDQKPYTTTIPA